MSYATYLEYPLSISEGGAPSELVCLSTTLHNDGLIDRGSPLPVYLFEERGDGSDRMSAHVVGLWGVAEGVARTLLQTARYVHTSVQDKSLAPVVAVCESLADDPACVLLGHSVHSESLDLLLQDREFSHTERVRLCAQIARGVSVLHEHRVANLPLDARVMLVEPDGTLTMYPLGNLFDESDGSHEPVLTHVFEHAVQDDLRRLHGLFLHVLGLNLASESDDRVIADVLDRLDSESERWSYMRAVDLADDLESYLAGRPIHWIHTGVFSRMAVRVSARPRIEKIAACVLGALVLGSVGAATYSTIQKENVSQAYEEEFERDQEADLAEAYDLLTSIQATVEQRYESGDIDGALRLTEMLSSQQLGIRHYQPELARESAKVIAASRLRAMRDSEPESLSVRPDLLRQTVLDARDSEIWDWLLEESGDYKEILVAAAQEY